MMGINAVIGHYVYIIHSNVRKKLTGISFVTKLNHDIESQLADIAAHYFNVESRFQDGLIPNYPKTHDADVIKILKSKTFNYKKDNSSPHINSYYKMY
jgi:hypothetical protein